MHASIQANSIGHNSEEQLNNDGAFSWYPNSVDRLFPGN